MSAATEGKVHYSLAIFLDSLPFDLSIGQRFFHKVRVLLRHVLQRLLVASDDCLPNFVDTTRVIQ